MLPISQAFVSNPYLSAAFLPLPMLFVAVGCGPAGMMFLHALQKKKAGGGIGHVNVTCFERAASAGGIWRDIPSDDLARSKPENVPLA